MGMTNRTAPLKRTTVKSNHPEQNGTVAWTIDGAADAKATRAKPERMRQRKRPSSTSIPGRIKHSLSFLMVPSAVAMILASGLYFLQRWLPHTLPNDQIVLIVLAAGLSLLGICAVQRQNLSGIRRDTVSDSPSLLEKNRRLADRLEALEDQTWEIRESEEVHRSLAEAFGDVVIHRDSNGEIVFSNEVFATYFNAEILPPHPQNEREDDRKEAQTPGRSPLDVTSRDIELQTKRGKRWFSWADLSVRDPVSGAVCMRSVGRDITRRKSDEQKVLAALQKARTANSAKSRFLAMVSHEIRTPLNGVIGMAGLLRDTPLRSDQENYVDAIGRSGQTLLSLIEDLLDTARIENDQLTLATRSCNLQRLVEDVTDLVAPMAHENGLQLATYVDPMIPQDVVCDPARLRQVLLNLIGNAVKFTCTGGVGIEVRAANAQKAKKGFTSIEFSVRDSGPGLAQVDQDRIFEEFVQTTQGATREHGGAGLGLAISMRLVRLMGGTIEVESLPDKGATFHFALDVAVEISSESQPKQMEKADCSVAIIMPRSPARNTFVRLVRACVHSADTFDSVQSFCLNRSSRPDIQLVIADIGDLTPDEFAGLRTEISDGARLIAIGNVTGASRTGSAAQENLDGWLTMPVRKTSLRAVIDNTTKPLNAPSLSPDLSGDQVSGHNEGLKFLLAEDNPINALLARSLFNKLGHRVHHVENGEAAVEAFSSEHFDAVFMDLHMPIMDGIEALQEIRSRDGWGKTCPLFVLSADGQSDVKEQALTVGADNFLMKPLDLHAITALLDSLQNEEAEPGQDSLLLAK